MTQVNDVGSMELLVLDRGDRRQLYRAAGDRRAAVSVAGVTDDGNGDRPEPETSEAELLALREGDVFGEDDVSVLWERVALVFCWWVELVPDLRAEGFWGVFIFGDQDEILVACLLGKKQS